MPIPFTDIDLYPQLKQLEPYMSTKSIDFRPLPTPEQVRAHGEGGLWEANDKGGHRVHYKFWDRDRTTPWYDCSSPSGSGFCSDGQPWPNSAKRTPDPAKFHPLNPDGTPRDWAEIDAIVAQGVPSVAAATEPEPESDYRAPTDAELRAHVANGGMWEQYVSGHRYLLTGLRADNSLWGWGSDSWHARDDGWLLDDAQHRKLRPVDRQGKPMPWSKAQAAVEAPDLVVTPPPDGKFQVGDVVRVLRFSGEEKFSNSNPGWNPQMAEHLTGTVTVQSIRACIRAAGWAWPIERVSFVLRPSKAEPKQRIEAVVPATIPTPEFRKLTREIVEANPGQLWELHQDSWKGRVWRLKPEDKADFAVESVQWDTDNHYIYFPWSKKEWRPLYDNHQPMPWSELKASVSLSQPISVRLSDSMPLTIATAGPVSSTGRLVSHADSLGASAVLQIEDAVRRAIAERVSLSPPAALPKDGDPITVANAVAIAREGARQAMQEVGQASRRSIDTLAASDLDIAAEHWYALSRQPNETDEQLRQRCRDAKAKENPMATNLNPITGIAPTLPNFAAMPPEDRARYRAALDAADPPTFRDALRSGLEHAPVELALDKLHTFVSRLADLWTEGNEEERATVRRFLRDLLSSDYGKAAIGLGAGFTIPHAAPLAAKLLPDDKDAGPLLRRVGFILVERGTATGAKRLGLDIWDAAGPMLDELRNMLRDLVKGMKQAETVAGFLPPASPKLDLAADVFEADTLSAQKR